MIKHVPVLAQEILQSLPWNLESMIDGTTWHGWHTLYLTKDNKNKINIVCIDADNAMLSKAKVILEWQPHNFYFINDSYSNLETILWNLSFNKVDFILLDLGVNMEHFKDTSRWFSIKWDASLDMRFDKRQSFTAKTLIDTYKKQDIESILIKYWDFGPKFAALIADEIIKNKTKITSTMELKSCLKNVWINEKKLAVIFQCLRIAVNSELKKLEDFLKIFGEYLNKWWRCAIITYHSVEDRITKLGFKELEQWGRFKLVNKHVIKPTYKETINNSASRSAKLRIIEAL